MPRTILAATALTLVGVGCAGPATDLAYTPSTPAGRLGYAKADDTFERGRASYYSDRLAGRRTASGARYDPDAFTAAHRTLPMGTLVDVATLDNRHVVVRINDRGPYVRGRVIDLCAVPRPSLGCFEPARWMWCFGSSRSRRSASTRSDVRIVAGRRRCALS